MNATNAGSPSGRVWEQIEKEKGRDRLIMRLCIAAWVGAGIVVLAASILIGLQAKEIFGGFIGGALPFSTVAGTLLPLIGMLWNLCLLVAALATVGVFLRFRSASLAEIQLRLAALEEMLASRGQ
jgi:hypothetical protein